MSTPPPTARPRFRDGPLTVALLILGVYNVTTTVAMARMMPQWMAQTYAKAGIGHYTSVTLATNIGWIVIIVQVVSLIIAIGVTVPRLRAGRRSFWIPLVVGAVCLFITAVLFVIAILGDPAFAISMRRMGG